MAEDPNWFVAFPFDAVLDLPDPPPQVRILAPEDRHLTVAFLGAVDEAAARRAWTVARNLPIAPVQVRLGQVKRLGRGGSALAATLYELALYTWPKDRSTRQFEIVERRPLT